MAATSTRKRTAKMVAPETSRATGSMQVLPAGAPEVVVAAPDAHIAVAAMADPKKPAAPSKPATSKPAAPKKEPAAWTEEKTKQPKDPTAAKFGKPDPFKPADTSGWGTAKSHSTGHAGDPDVAYAFSVKIGNIAYAMFSEIAGLSWKAEPIPVRVGGNNEYALNMRGPGKFEPLTLKRGWFASSGEFMEMLKESLSGEGERTSKGRVNMTITVLDRKYQEIGNYSFHNAFIIEYSGPALNSMSGQVGFEQIRMAYDYFEYKAK